MKEEIEETKEEKEEEEKNKEMEEVKRKEEIQKKIGDSKEGRTIFVSIILLFR